MVDQLRKVAGRIVAGLALVALLTGAFPSSSRYPAFLPPQVNGVLPSLFADFTTEGTSNHYWFLGKQYSGESAWCAAIPGCSFSRTGNASYTNSAGNLAQVSGNVLRFDYDPVTLILKGILLEGGSTNLLVQSNTFTNAAWNQLAIGTPAQNAVGPDGTSNSAWTFTDTVANSTHGLFQSPSLTASQTYTTSLYVKHTNHQYVFIRGQSDYVTYDIVNGLVTNATTPGGGEHVSGTIQPYSNGWFRLTFTFTPSGSVNDVFFGFANAAAYAGGSYAGTGSDTFLAYGAQTENLGFASSYIPTAAGTVTRNQDNFTTTPITTWFNGTSGTLMNAADIEGTSVGQTQTYIGDGTDTTRLQLSFSSPLAAFAANSGTSLFSISGGQPNPNVLFRQAVSYSSGGNQSLYASDGANAGTSTMSAAISGATQLNIGTNPSDGHPTYGHIGTIGFWPSAANAGALQALTAPPPWVPTAVGILPSVLADFVGQNYMVNGYVMPSFAAWQRETAATFSRAGPAMFTGSNGLLQTASTNVMRFDYDPVSLAPKGVFLESSATNITPHSNDLTSPAWVKTGTAIASGAATSPDGTTDAFSFTGSGGNTNHILNLSTGIGTPTSASTNYTTSFYVKNSTMNFVSLVFTSNSDSAGWVAAVYDLTNGTVSQTAHGADGALFGGGTITNAGSGWYRISVSGNLGANTDGTMLIQGAGAATGNSFGGFGLLTYNDTGNVFYLFGAQLESGTFASSYIATTTATAVRAADLFSSGNFGLSTSLTLLAETTIVPSGAISATQRLFGSGLNADAPMFIATNTILDTFNQILGSTGTSLGSGSFSGGKVASAVAGSSSLRRVSANQSAASGDSQALFSGAPATLFIGMDNGGNNEINSDMNRIGAWYGTVATGAQLQALTVP